MKNINVININKETLKKIVCRTVNFLEEMSSGCTGHSSHTRPRIKIKYDYKSSLHVSETQTPTEHI